MTYEELEYSVRTDINLVGLLTNDELFNGSTCRRAKMPKKSQSSFPDPKSEVIADLRRVAVHRDIAEMRYFRLNGYTEAKKCYLTLAQFRALEKESEELFVYTEDQIEWIVQQVVASM